MVAMRRLARICGAIALLQFTPAQAGTGKVIAGWLENIQLLAAADHRVKAKLDSGAKTSSIHARNMEPFTRDGADWIRFDLVLSAKKEQPFLVSLERPVIRHVRIKEHDGSHNRRPIVELEFCFNGRRQRTEFSLVDRSSFNYSVLLGRRFLAGVAVIDPDATFLTEPDCPSATVAGERP